MFEFNHFANRDDERNDGCASDVSLQRYERERSFWSKTDERGGGLSGGERRRLGLARAILKRAPILLLDEPTANLDPAAEEAMLDLIRQATRGRTTLIATHSAAVAAMADRVVRL